jgi:hypothetical protein
MKTILTKIEKELILGLWYKYTFKNISINKHYFNAGQLIKINFFYNYKLIKYKKSFIGLCLKKNYNKYMTNIKLIFLIANYKVIYNSIITLPLLNHIELLSKKKKVYKKSNFRNSKLYFLKYLNTKNLIQRVILM